LEVVERFEMDEAIMLMEQIPAPPQNGYAPPPTTLNKTAIGRVSYLRLRKNGESILAETHSKLSLLAHEHSQEKRKNEELQKELDKIKKQVQQLESEQKLQSQRFTEECTRRQQIEQIKRQLEADLGKVREHIGRKTFEEVLGTGAKEPR
jgi:hypothetical protein